MTDSRLYAEQFLDTFLTLFERKGIIQRPEKEVLTEVVSILEVWMDKALSIQHMKGYTDGIISGKRIALAEAMSGCIGVQTSKECLKVIKAIQDSITFMGEKGNEVSIH